MCARVPGRIIPQRVGRAAADRKRPEDTLTFGNGECSIHSLPLLLHVFGRAHFVERRARLMIMMMAWNKSTSPCDYVLCVRNTIANGRRDSLWLRAKSRAHAALQ